MNILEKKAVLYNTAKELFFRLLVLPNESRYATKEITGMTVLVREIGTRNLVYFTIGQPSEASKFFVSEKATRSEILGDYASQNSEDPDNLKFAGSITFDVHGKKYQASCSGLKPTEDVFVSITLLSVLFITKTEALIGHLTHKGAKLPDFESTELSYLKKIAI